MFNLSAAHTEMVVVTFTLSQPWSEPHMIWST